MENPIKIHDFGGTPIFGNTHIYELLVFFLHKEVKGGVAEGCAAIRHVSRGKSLPTCHECL